MTPSRVSKLYEKSCPRDGCGGDVLFSAYFDGEQDLVCLQCANRFDQRVAPPIDTRPPEDEDGEEMTSRKYVESKLEGLARGQWIEVNHVDWLGCRGAKDGCTLLIALRDYRRRVPFFTFVQRHGYPGIWIKRIA